MIDNIINTVGAVLVLIILDTLLGIILSVKAREFDIRELPRFLQTAVLPYVGGLILLGVAAIFAGQYGPQVAAIFFAAAAFTAAKFLTEIYDKSKQIFGELEIPDEYIYFDMSDLKHDLIIEIKKAIIEIMEKKTTA